MDKKQEKALVDEEKFKKANVKPETPLDVKQTQKPERK